MDQETVEKDVMAENNSGRVAVEYKIIVKVDPTEKTTRGGIHIPDVVRERQMRERVIVRLVSVGGRAFQDPEWGDPVPKIGDKVQVAKYAGEPFDGPDGYMYIVMVDKNIEAIVKN